MKLVFVDPGTQSTNDGDRIIAEAVRGELFGHLRPEQRDNIPTVPLHGTLSADQRQLLRSATVIVQAGTNLLSRNARRRTPWQWSREDIMAAAGKLIMIGVGWWQYEPRPITPMTRRLYSNLAGPIPWGVRDKYSRDKLLESKITAFHSSCPTLWSVREQILPGTSSRVVTTLCDYSQDPRSDRALLHALLHRFDEVALWPQGPKDEKYFRQLNVAGVEVLTQGVASFREQLQKSGTGYVGLRLHAGIEAMRLGVPSLILSVDNRAAEISKSVQLIAYPRFAYRQWQQALNSTSVHRLELPLDDIANWKLALNKAAGWLE